MPRRLILPTNGREYRIRARNDVLEALAFYLHELESGRMFYADVFRDIAYAYLERYPRQVGPFLNRAERIVSDLVSCRL